MRNNKKPNTIQGCSSKANASEPRRINLNICVLVSDIFVMSELINTFWLNSILHLSCIRNSLNFLIIASDCKFIF